MYWDYRSKNVENKWRIIMFNARFYWICCYFQITILFIWYQTHFDQYYRTTWIDIYINDFICPPFPSFYNLYISWSFTLFLFHFIALFRRALLNDQLLQKMQYYRHTQTELQTFRMDLFHHKIKRTWDICLMQALIPV